tara:strand:- start:1050 stop:1745 length:696 start_codon:yes stop_codon:yes gene_type:complete
MDYFTITYISIVLAILVKHFINYKNKRLLQKIESNKKFCRLEIKNIEKRKKQVWIYNVLLKSIQKIKSNSYYNSDIEMKNFNMNELTKACIDYVKNDAPIIYKNTGYWPKSKNTKLYEDELTWKKIIYEHSPSSNQYYRRNGKNISMLKRNKILFFCPELYSHNSKYNFKPWHNEINKQNAKINWKKLKMDNQFNWFFSYNFDSLIKENIEDNNNKYSFNWHGVELSIPNF